MTFPSLLARATAAFIFGYSTLGVAASAAAPERISFASHELYPETASWSTKSKAFFVSSIRHGTVGKVTLDGSYTDFIVDPQLVSTIGVLADDAHNTLWVTNSDPGAGIRSSEATKEKLAGVAAYDESTGKLRRYFDLTKFRPGAHFANDIAVDDEGNAYVTDSFTPTIYRIGTDGNVSVLVENAQMGAGKGYNLNGIAWNKDGFLLVGNTTTGRLFRVSTRQPGRFDEVRMSEALVGADGFHLVDGQHLVIAQQHLTSGAIDQDRAVELVSTDGWSTAQMSRQAKAITSSPTSATQVSNDVYVLGSRIDTLGNPEARKVSTYVLQRF